jgi:hypothetical protein
MNNYLDYFDNYVFKGLMPIAVYRGTKQPVGSAWNNGWSAKKWRHYFYENEYEMGLLWNREIIDIETDNEHSNDFLNKLIGDLKRPIYKSQRSYHNLFLTPHNSLTKANLFGRKGEKIEIFGKRTFTMAPPSQHMGGEARYQFINDHWPPPPCPNPIKALYFQQKNIKRISKEKTLSKCSDCGEDFCLHKQRLALEVRSFLKKNMKWKCIKCRKNYCIDIKEMCRQLKSTIH